MKPQSLVSLKKHKLFALLTFLVKKSIYNF